LADCNISQATRVLRIKSTNKPMDENLREVLMPIAILGSFGAAVYFFTKAITDYILKKRMIDKGFVNEDTQAIFKSYANTNKYASLKWGLIVLFGGLGLMIIDFVPASHESPLPYGIFTVCVSLGFLIYYFIVRKETSI
jgi:hypothetical protein